LKRKKGKEKKTKKRDMLKEVKGPSGTTDLWGSEREKVPRKR